MRKISPYSKAIGAEHRLRFLSPLSAMMTTSCERNVLQWDMKQQTNSASVSQYSKNTHT